MVRLLTFFISLISFNLAHATVRNVSIQCRPEGPVYSGTIEYPADSSEWSMTPSDEGKCVMDAKIPIKIEFNGLIYLSSTISKVSTPYAGVPENCADRFAVKGLYMAANLYTVKNSAGYEMRAALYPDKTNKMVMSLPSFGNASETCHVF